MTRRWTPQRFMRMRRIRVAACVISLVLSGAVTFGFSARKTIALNVNGETRTVTTYAASVPRLLQEQGIAVRSHDKTTSTNGTDNLTDRSVVTVRSAYQASITIDGQEVPFWTVAGSADELLGFFTRNERAAAAKITVNIDNVYNQLTGGMIINREGPVTVIADGKTSVAQNGKLPAASILDSKGITLNREDRVSVEQEQGDTILRVRRVTHQQETRTKTVPFGTQTIIDPSLQPGESMIRQQGEPGELRQIYDVTYVDGVAESETLHSETTTKIAIDQVIALGPDRNAQDGGDTGNGNADHGSNQETDTQNGDKDESNRSASGADDNADNSPATPNIPDSNGSGNSSSGSTTTPPSTPSPAPAPTPAPTPTPTPTPTPSNGRLWHPTPAQAQAYAAGAAAQYGWTGQDWSDLVKLWTRESSWLWYAQNPGSGAYGIPQSLPANKMAQFGANWKDDAAVQIDWGLHYIAQRYGSPSKAWQHSEQVGWY